MLRSIRCASNSGTASTNSADLLHMPTQHPRPWIAAVLSVFFSPLGLLYVRRFKLALLFFAFPLGFRMLAYVTGSAVSLAASVAEIACWIRAVVLAWRLAKSGAERELHWTSRWYGMLGVALATSCCATAACG